MARRFDLGAALVLTAFALAAVAHAWGMPIGRWGRPGSGFFPLVLAAVLAGCGLVLLGLALVQRPAAGAAPVEFAWRRPALALGILLAYALVLERLVFLPATFAVLALLLRVVGAQAWGVTVAAAGAITLLAWTLFEWLGVRLPPGPWRF